MVVEARKKKKDFEMIFYFVKGKLCNIRDNITKGLILFPIALCVCVCVTLLCMCVCELPQRSLIIS